MGLFMVSIGLKILQSGHLQDVETVVIEAVICQYDSNLTSFVQDPDHSLLEIVRADELSR